MNNFLCVILSLMLLFTLNVFTFSPFLPSFSLNISYPLSLLFFSSIVIYFYIYLSSSFVNLLISQRKSVLSLPAVDRRLSGEGLVNNQHHFVIGENTINVNWRCWKYNCCQLLVEKWLSAQKVSNLSRWRFAKQSLACRWPANITLSALKTQLLSMVSNPKFLDLRKLTCL